jgi:hypothetical protein
MSLTSNRVAADDVSSLTMAYPRGRVRPYDVAPTASWGRHTFGMTIASDATVHHYRQARCAQVDIDIGVPIYRNNLSVISI